MRKPLKHQLPDCIKTRKRSFATKEAANFFSEAYGGARIYKCYFCEYWHITTQPLKKSKNTS